MFNPLSSQRRAMRAAILLPLLGAGATAAFAQSAQIVASQAASESNIGALIGMPVVNDTSEKLGDINYLLVNPSGQITTAVVGVGGFLGVGEKNVGFAYASLTLVPDGQGKRQARIATTKAQLEAAPKFEWRETPTAVQVEETLKSAADKIKATAKSLGDKASETMKKN